MRMRADFVIQVKHALQSNLHTLRLFMLNGKDDGEDDCLESLRIELNHTLSAISNDVMHELEEAFSEFRERNEVIGNHIKS